MGCHSPSINVEFDGRERLKESLEDGLVNRISGDVLTNRNTVFLTQRVAEIVGVGLVLDHHFVTALAAVEQTVQERLSGSGDAAGFIAVILGVVTA
jgi:hypothetical protein